MANETSKNKFVYIPDKNLMKYRENPKIEFDKNPVFNESFLCTNGLKVFKDKNVTPYNHYRKVACPGNKCIKNNTIVVYKDNFALNCKCKSKPNPPNPNFISSYKTLNETRNRSYENNLKFPSSEYVNKLEHQTKINKTVKKFRNPIFKTNGAVSGRNRIAALKNGNLHNNVYNKRCDIRTSWNKTNVMPKKICKPYHYGGKWKFALLSCPPKN